MYDNQISKPASIREMEIMVVKGRIQEADKQRMALTEELAGVDMRRQELRETIDLLSAEAQALEQVLLMAEKQRNLVEHDGNAAPVKMGTINPGRY